MQNIKENRFTFTQSCVKDLEKEETCPFRWKSQWLDKDPRLRMESEDLAKGQYFEYLVLGATAKGVDQAIGLPLLANGSKSVDQIRIESQAERAKRMLFDTEYKDFLGLSVLNIQLKLSNKDEDEAGTIDFTASDEAGDNWIIDLKLTKDLSSSRSEYGWGNDWEDLDLVQMIHYQHLYKNELGILPRVGLFVFDYSPKKRIEFGELIISETKREQREFRFNEAKKVVNLYNENGWIKIPAINECSRCKLDCDKRLLETPVIKKVINY